MIAIAREHGIQERRIYQILKTRGVGAGRLRKIDPQKPPLSKVHASIGKMVYEFYFEKGKTRREAANDLGVSVITLLNIERGRHHLDLFDLQDVAMYLKTTVGRLLNER